MKTLSQETLKYIIIEFKIELIVKPKKDVLTKENKES